MVFNFCINRLPTQYVLQVHWSLVGLWGSQEELCPLTHNVLGILICASVNSNEETHPFKSSLQCTRDSGIRESRFLCSRGWHNELWNPMQNILRGHHSPMGHPTHQNEWQQLVLHKAWYPKVGGGDVMIFLLLPEGPFWANWTRGYAGGPSNSNSQLIGIPLRCSTVSYREGWQLQVFCSLLQHRASSGMGVHLAKLVKSPCSEEFKLIMIICRIFTPLAIHWKGFKGG